MRPLHAYAEQGNPTRWVLLDQHEFHAHLRLTVTLGPSLSGSYRFLDRMQQPTTEGPYTFATPWWTLEAVTRIVKAIVARVLHRRVVVHRRFRSKRSARLRRRRHRRKPSLKSR